MPQSTSLTRRGFTLIEILISVAIIAILIGLTLPAIQKVRMQSGKVTSENNLKQMGLAANNYASVKGFLPPAIGWDNSQSQATENGTVGTFFLHILPYTENAEAFNQFFQTYFDQQIPGGAIWKNASGYINPSSTDVGTALEISFGRKMGYIPDPGPAPDPYAWTPDYLNVSGTGYANWNTGGPLGGRTWLAGGKAFRSMNSNGAAVFSPLIKTYSSPTDPTYNPVSNSSGINGNSSTLASYLPNRELLQLRIPMTQITDGASQTMVLAEGYASCSQVDGIYARDNDWVCRGSEYMENIVNLWDGTSDPFGNYHYWPEAIDQVYVFGSQYPDSQDLLTYNTAADFGRIPAAATKYQPAVPYASVAPMVYNTKTSTWSPTLLTQPTFQDRPAWINGDPNYQTSGGNCSINMPQSLTPGTILVVMADGSVHGISSSVSYGAWQAAITPNGNEVIDSSFFGD